MSVVIELYDNEQRSSKDLPSTNMIEKYSLKLLNVSCLADVRLNFDIFFYLVCSSDENNNLSAFFSLLLR